MGKELARIGAPFGQPEWSALALLEAPERVHEAHRNFIDAGAEVITVNAYAVVPYHIGAERFDARGRELAGLAGELARRAADAGPHPVRVAGCLPPVFGSYVPERFDPAVAPDLLRVLIEAQAPWVDLWVGETIGSLAEAEAMMAALDDAAAVGDRWLSYAVDDERQDGRVTLWSGESMPDAAQLAVDLGADAVLVNCAAPESISRALIELEATVRAAGSGVPLGAYANAFEPRPPGLAANETILDRREDLTADVYGGLAREWVAAGASIIGGCCGIHPEHIAAIGAGLVAAR